MFGKKNLFVMIGRYYDKNFSSKVVFNNLFVIKKCYLKFEVFLMIDFYDLKF